MIQISIEIASKLIRQNVSRSSNLAMWPCLPQPSHWPLPCQWSVAGRCETAVTIQLKRLGCPSRCHRIYGKPSKSLGQVMWLSWSLTSSSWHWCINDLCLTVWNPLVSWPSMATVLKIQSRISHNFTKEFGDSYYIWSLLYQSSQMPLDSKMEILKT